MSTYVDSTILSLKLAKISRKILWQVHAYTFEITSIGVLGHLSAIFLVNDITVITSDRG